MTTAAQAAATWWADQLKQAPNHDNGEAVQSAFANSIARSLPPVTDEQIATFHEALVEGIKQKLAEEESYRQMMIAKYPDSKRRPAEIVVSVDYNPDQTLDAALDVATILSGGLRLPIKTVMWIEESCVKVSCGYRAPIEVIWEVTQS